MTGRIYASVEARTRAHHEDIVGVEMAPSSTQHGSEAPYATTTPGRRLDDSRTIRKGGAVAP
jgi:hypothetical protein